MAPKLSFPIDEALSAPSSEPWSEVESDPGSESDSETESGSDSGSASDFDSDSDLDEGSAMKPISAKPMEVNPTSKPSDSSSGSKRSSETEHEGSKRPRYNQVSAKANLIPQDEVNEFTMAFKGSGMIRELPESVVRNCMELMGEAKRAELREEFKNLHVAELELYIKKAEFKKKLTRFVLQILKSD